MISIGKVLALGAFALLVLHSRAHAVPITSTLDYSVVFGSSGTDTITGTLTLNAAGSIESDIMVTGAVLPGDYVYPFTIAGIGDPSVLGFDGADDTLIGTFSPSDALSPVVFSAFELENIPSSSDFVSTSVTNLAAVPEPASLALICTGLAGFGAIRRRRKRA